jgi:putative transposase
LFISRKTKTPSKQKTKDEQLKEQILDLRKKHRNYGTDRLALALNRPESVIHRVVKKFNLQIRRKRNQPFKSEDQGFKASPIANLTKNLISISPNLVWASDFTYLSFQNKTYYLATFIDIFSRKIVGWNFSDTHDAELILEALRKAIKSENKVPDICHSDQGSEYRSGIYQEVLESYGIKQSMSPKASPWRNGFQESFYAGFKADLGDENRFNCLGELIEAIAHTLYSYNTERIHSVLKTSPNKFLEKYFIHKNQEKKPVLAKIINFQKVVP